MAVIDVPAKSLSKASFAVRYSGKLLREDRDYAPYWGGMHHGHDGTSGSHPTWKGGHTHLTPHHSHTGHQGNVRVWQQGYAEQIGMEKYDFELRQQHLYEKQQQQERFARENARKKQNQKPKTAPAHHIGYKKHDYHEHKARRTERERTRTAAAI